ncbi:MAG: hypothetical protein RBS48_11685, partial [Ignavibacteriaceae bacterium]|nr:hypothetical protein [Ignavibacteriaceae bacterium]
FIKAFGLVKITQFTPLAQQNSEFMGILWFLNTLLFIGVALAFLLKKEWWWVPGIFAIVLSQILIIINWQDAKFGTIANLIILVSLIVGIAFGNFNIQFDNERKMILSEGNFVGKIITNEMISDLPIPIQKWLDYSGIIGKEQIHTVYLKQKGLMKLKPDQKYWLKAEAEQYFNIDNPAFIWRVNTSMVGLPVIGRDLFFHGRGKMQIKLAGLISVVNVTNNLKLNQSTLQRFLSEISWFPYGALSPYIEWEPIDEYSAKAIMSYGESSGSAIFHFDENGALEKLVALRFKDITDQDPKEWVARVVETETLNNTKIPTKLEISWNTDEGEFTWFKFQIYDLTYN